MENKSKNEMIWYTKLRVNEKKRKKKKKLLFPEIWLGEHDGRICIERNAMKSSCEP